jgi:ribonuclease HI
MSFFAEEPLSPKVAIMTQIPSPDEIIAGGSGRGGWTREQLAKWGVPWPPPSGWRKELERRYREEQERARPKEPSGPPVTMIHCFFDGACEPINPGGHAAYGAVVKVDGAVVLSEGGYVGHGSAMSNNVGEYAGVIRVLETLAELPGSAVIYGDSNLVINQLSGRWKARGGLYLPYYEKAKMLLAPLKPRIRFEWIPREQNDACDRLSKDVLHARGITFHIQSERVA